MNDEKTVQDKPAGVLDHMKGAKSRDVDDPGPAQAVAPESTEPVKAKEPEKPEPAPEAVPDDRLVLKQEIAKLQRTVAQLNPYAQLGQAVQQDPKGRNAIERWQKGGKLFDTPEGEEVDDVAAPAGMTREELRAELDARDAQRQTMDTLNGLARENLPNFDKVSKSQVYAEFLDNNLRATWSGAMPVTETVLGWSDDGLAKNYSAMERAYRQVLADNPKVIEAAKRAGKAEQKERAEAAIAASGTSGTSTTTTSEEQPEKTETELMIDRMVNAKGIGKPFSTVARKR
jgi:hypothetical protein